MNYAAPTATCTGRNGKPLRSYPDRSTADDAAKYASSTWGNRMVAYSCGRCARWHLCPADRHTPSHECDSCSKRSYDSEGDAERRAEILRDERCVALRVYACPAGDGWHLTSRR